MWLMILDPLRLGIDRNSKKVDGTLAVDAKLEAGHPFGFSAAGLVFGIFSQADNASEESTFVWDYKNQLHHFSLFSFPTMWLMILDPLRLGIDRNSKKVDGTLAVDAKLEAGHPFGFSAAGLVFGIFSQADNASEESTFVWDYKNQLHHLQSQLYPKALILKSLPAHQGSFIQFQPSALSHLKSFPLSHCQTGFPIRLTLVNQI
ncbi:hypothetical protein AAES_67437 [Amazona aestiva]|uniref:Uncharacterized protein n=1 Tax=Amazona aestiva TaxID=12930 RepID=A0A0Q3Q3F9_AMAAE|nr:hypothetical protein AAES_67437 [Amazona aestiva]